MMRRTPFLLFFLLVGCADTVDTTVTYEVSESDVGRSCEAICEDTIFTDGPLYSYELSACQWERSEPERPAVTCTFWITEYSVGLE